MDENLLFTAEILSLNGDLVFSRVAQGQHVIKNVGAQSYLTVDDAQLRCLYYFSTPKTVPAVMEEMVRDRSCPALREFYELILKAHRSGILLSAKTKEKRVAAIRWFLEIEPRIILGFASLFLLVAVGCLVWFGLELPTRWDQWALGWLLSCLLLSLGDVLAASALRRAGGEVYKPCFHWRTLVPRFRVDLRDAQLSSGFVQTAVCIAQSAPLALGLVLLLVWVPAYAIVPAAILMIWLRPLGTGLFGELGYIYRRRRLLSTEVDLQFFANRSPGYRLRREIVQLEWKMVLLELFFAFVWVAIFVRVAYECAGFPLTMVTAQGLDYWLESAKLIGCAVLVAWVLFVFFLFVGRILALFKSTHINWSLSFRRYRSHKSAGKTPALTPIALIRENWLLRRLDYTAQQDLAKLMKPFQAKMWQHLVEVDEQPSLVGIISSGTITAFRRNKSGRRNKHLQLKEGDIFGAHALIDPYNPYMELRTNSPLQAFTVTVAEFRDLVVARLGKNAVYEATQKQVFLRRMALCSAWKPHVVSRFAQIAQVVHYKPGELILRQGGEARAFYVLFEGAARVMIGSRRIGRIQPGDFIGEIGLLQNSDASADVEAEEDSLCMVVNKVDFLRFLTHNHNVALQLEAIASKRLKKAIYPMDAFSFDA